MHLILDLEQCYLSAGHPSKLLFSLYNHTIHQFISKQYCLCLDRNSLPIGCLMDEQKALFKDIQPDALDQELYIICYIYRCGAFDIFIKSDSRELLRPYGAAVLPVAKYMAALQQELGHFEVILAEEAKIYQTLESEEFVQIPFHILEGSTNKLSVPPRKQGFIYRLALYEGDISHMTIINAQQLKNLTLIDSIYDGKWVLGESQIMVTLSSVCFAEAKLCNIEVRMSVKRNNDYASIPECVHFGHGMCTANKTDQAKSVIFEANNHSVYNQTFCVSVPEDCHLYFECVHIQAKPNIFGIFGKERRMAFAFINGSALICSNYVPYTLPLYAFHKGAAGNGNGNYLDDRVLKAVATESHIEIVVRIGDLNKSFALLIFGLIREAKISSTSYIPKELISVMSMFVVHNPVNSL